MTAIVLPLWLFEVKKRKQEKTMCMHKRSQDVKILGERKTGEKNVKTRSIFRGGNALLGFHIARKIIYKAGMLSNLNFLFRFFAVKICADLYFILTIYESPRDTINIVRFKTFIFISPHGLTGCQRGFLKWYFLGNCGDFLELNRRIPSYFGNQKLYLLCLVFSAQILTE